jgi:ACS family sodium-dependent inorganic phosphate cotransporter-like MFS transporter 5
VSPTTNSFFINWSPPNEKSRLLGFAYAGCSIGSVVALTLGGFLCENGFYYGWGSSFVLFGATGLVWLVGFFFLTADSPLEHKFISSDEKSYIVNSIPDFGKSTRKGKQQTPWLGILTSKPCLAIIICNTLHNWGYYVFLTQTPTYIKEVLHLDIKKVFLI